jgi:hypothetical protein
MAKFLFLLKLIRKAQIGVLMDGKTETLEGFPSVEEDRRIFVN